MNANAGRKRRVALIGPLLPYRGGIAQHTTMLHRALQQMAELRTWSFSRQYPAWLFPGESDRDPTYEGHREPGVSYLIDSTNPLTWSKAARQIQHFDPQTVVFPWWTIFWAPTFGYLAHRIRRAGHQIVFFCHNVVDHEAAAWKTALSRAVLRQADRFVVHTHKDRERLLELLPDAVVTVHPHPIYDQFPPPRGTLPRRRNLELLFYGFVRPYKGLDILIEAMGLLEDQDVQLTIAGEFWEGEEQIRRRIEALGLSEHVELCPRYHTEQETAELFARADFVVLPYRNATGSGVIPVAYHYGKPVIATRVGGLPDVVEEGRTGFLVNPDDPAALASTIKKAGELDREATRCNIETFKKRYNWTSLAHVIMGR